MISLFSRTDGGSRSAGTGSDRDIAARSWDLASLDRDYTEFIRRFRGRLAGYRAGDVRGRNALVERMYLIHDYRMFRSVIPTCRRDWCPADGRGDWRTRFSSRRTGSCAARRKLM
jgi:phenylacetic acid degradation operon negative regulatory protein